MMRIVSSGLIAFVALAAASPATAQGNLRAALRFGADFGGDPVAQFEYSDGTTPEVQAGGGLLLSAGGVLQAFSSGGHGLDLQANVGVKYRTIPPATNQSASWLRFPVEGLVMYRTPVGLRVGGGATVHVANVMKASGGALDSRLEFENKPGVLLQAEYVSGRFGFDLRYTIMEYELAEGGTGTVQANSFGAGISYWLGS